MARGKTNRRNSRKSNRTGTWLARVMGSVLMLFVLLMLLFVGVKIMTAKPLPQSRPDTVVTTPTPTEDAPETQVRQPSSAKYSFYDELKTRSNEVEAEVAARIKLSEQNQTVVDSDNYRVQIGAFRDKDQADRLRARMILRNYPVMVLRSNSLYLVQIGPYFMRDEALKIENRLRREGLDTLLKSYVVR